MTPETKAPLFLANVTDNETLMTVNLLGNADARALGEIERVFSTVHSDANRKKMKRVDVDLRSLDFMNSSCFKTLVSWLAQVQEATEVDRYEIVFLSDPKKHWQKRSLTALTSFAPGLVRVETP